MSQVLEEHLPKDLANIVSSYSAPGPIECFKRYYKMANVDKDDTSPGSVDRNFYKLLETHINTDWKIDAYDENYKPFALDNNSNNALTLINQGLSADENMLIISGGGEAVVYVTYRNYKKYDRILNGESAAKYNNILFFGGGQGIGDDWLLGYNELERVSFYGMNNLRRIGNKWLSNCHKLIYIDFNGLFNLETVGDRWLSRCDKLESVHFEELKKLRHVGNMWMEFCNRLEIVDFFGLESLLTIGDNLLTFTNIYKEIFIIPNLKFINTPRNFPKDIISKIRQYKGRRKDFILREYGSPIRMPIRVPTIGGSLSNKISTTKKKSKKKSVSKKQSKKKTSKKKKSKKKSKK